MPASQEKFVFHFYQTIEQLKNGGQPLSKVQAEKALQIFATNLISDNLEENISEKAFKKAFQPYLSGPMSRYLKNERQVQLKRFVYLVKPFDENSIELILRIPEKGLAELLAEATATALTSANDEFIKVSIEQESKELAEDLSKLQKSYLVFNALPQNKASLIYEEKSRVAIELYSLLHDVEKLIPASNKGEVYKLFNVGGGSKDDQEDLEFSTIVGLIEFHLATLSKDPKADSLNLDNFLTRLSQIQLKISNYLYMKEQGKRTITKVRSKIYGVKNELDSRPDSLNFTILNFEFNPLVTRYSILDRKDDFSLVSSFSILIGGFFLSLCFSVFVELIKKNYLFIFRSNQTV